MPGSVLAEQPQLGAADAARLAKSLYALDASASELPSERDRNFRLDAGTRGRFVLKVFNAAEDREFVLAQARTLTRLAAHGPDVFPVPLETTDGETLGSWHDGRVAHAVWLQPLLPGRTVAATGTLGTTLPEDIGRIVGRMDLVLSAHPEPAARRSFSWAADGAAQVISGSFAFVPQERRPLLEEALAASTCSMRPAAATSTA